MTAPQVGIIGVGKLGAALWEVLASSGVEVKGFDLSPARRGQLAGRFNVLADIEGLRDADILFVLVDTTAEAGYSYDRLTRALRAAGELGGKQTLVINSTCGPEFFDLLPSLGIGCPVVYNPFFVRQGRVVEDIRSADFVLIGDDQGKCLPLLDVYRAIGLTRFVVMDRRAAAVTKLAINAYLTLKIAYANLVGDLCCRLGLSADMVLTAVGLDRRINPHFLRYGDGYGGPCLPVDTRQLSKLLADSALCTALPDAADQANERHLQFQVDRFIASQDPKQPVVVSGVSYKPGTDMIVNSQRLAFASRLVERGYSVTLRDSPAVIRQVRECYGTRFLYHEDPV